MSYSREELINYRIDRSKEALGDASLLVQKGRWNAAANRMYYACFYVVSAYLAYTGKKAATHAGIKSIFNKELVKSGKVARADGRLYNKLFTIRQDTDYEDFVNARPEDIRQLLPKISSLVIHIEGLIRSGR